MILLDAYPIHSEEAIERQLEREIVYVFPTKGEVKVFNEVGARIWTLADGTRTVRQISQVICQEYQVDATQSEADTSEFLKNLFDRQLITFVPASSG